LIRATSADVLVAEKIREDHIRELGYEMVRVIWAELNDLVALRRRIEAAVGRARSRGRSASSTRW